MYIRKISQNGTTKLMSFQNSYSHFSEMVYLEENVWISFENSSLVFNVNNLIISINLENGMLDFKDGDMIHKASECRVLHFEYFKTEKREVKKFLEKDVTYEENSSRIQSVGDIHFVRDSDNQIVSVRKGTKSIFNMETRYKLLGVMRSLENLSAQ